MSYTNLSCLSLAKSFESECIMVQSHPMSTSLPSISVPALLSAAAWLTAPLKDLLASVHPERTPPDSSGAPNPTDRCIHVMRQPASAQKESHLQFLLHCLRDHWGWVPAARRYLQKQELLRGQRFSREAIVIQRNMSPHSLPYNQTCNSGAEKSCLTSLDVPVSILTFYTKLNTFVSGGEKTLVIPLEWRSSALCNSCKTKYSEYIFGPQCRWTCKIKCFLFQSVPNCNCVKWNKP